MNLSPDSSADERFPLSNAYAVILYELDVNETCTVHLPINIQVLFYPGSRLP